MDWFSSDLKFFRGRSLLLKCNALQQINVLPLESGSIEV